MISPPDAIDVALRVTNVLDQLGVVHTIGGSIASSVAGEPRSTIDIDIIAALEERHVAALATELKADFYVDEAALARAVRERRSTNLIHQPTQTKIDLFVAGGTPLDEMQLARRQEVDLDGRRIFVHPPEDILLQKLRWFRLGGEVSDRQWRDILGIVRVQATGLDREYLRRQAPAIDVADLLEQASSRGSHSMVAGEPRPCVCVTTGSAIE